MGMTEEEAARYVRAAARLMMERIPREAGGTLIHAGLMKLINDMEAHHIHSCLCPRDQQVYCHVEKCQGGADLPSASVEENWRTCGTCNAGGHTCPGCGADVEHGRIGCRKCSPEQYTASQEPPWADEPSTDPAPVPWDRVVEGDWVRGGDGVYYLVRANRAENGKAYVTILVKGRENTYPREPEVEVLTKRGPTGLAVDTLAAVGLDPAVLATN